MQLLNHLLLALELELIMGLIFQIPGYRIPNIMEQQNKMDVDNNNIKRNTTKRKTPDNGLINEGQSITTQLCKLLCQKADEITFENTWKKNMKTRRQFLCSNVPTIVVTPIKSKELRSHKHFLEISAHYLFILQLIQFANSFNDAKNGQTEQKENQDGKQRI
ncbi:hypothetical protein RFI_00247, partial [Reticulomyxa filosa]